MVKPTLTPLERRILQELAREGRATAPMIAKKIGATQGTVRTILARLLKLGLVKRVDRGLYEYVENAEI